METQAADLCAQRVCNPLLRVIHMRTFFHWQRSATPLSAQPEMPVFRRSLKALALRSIRAQKGALH
jgi:hypothetical protein